MCAIIAMALVVANVILAVELAMTRSSPDGLLWEDNGLAINDSNPEPNELEAIELAIRETKSVFWDIGAYHGLYSIRLAKAGKKVVAFEPNLASYRVLERNIALNQVDVSPQNLALFSTGGILELLDDGVTSRIISPENTAYRTLVYGSALDSLLFGPSPNDPPDFIKIDAEGAEIEILRGAMVTLCKIRPKLLIEVHDYQLVLGIYLDTNRKLVENILSVVQYDFEPLKMIKNKLFAYPSDRPIVGHS